MRINRRSQRGALIAIVAIAVLVISTSPVAPQTSTSLTVAAIGDFDILMNTERNVDQAVAGGAKGVIGLGDYSYEGSIRGWKAMMEPLTSNGAWFARGNHDDLATFKTFMPGQSSQWSVFIRNARVIAIDTEQRIDVGTAQYNWLVTELGREPASGPKILVMHKPWWLGAGAQHPSGHFPGNATSMDGLMKTHGVDLVLAGHEHNYQRTQRNNIPYVIAGTGGRTIYPIAGSDPNTVGTCACIGHLLLTISDASLQGRFLNITGTQKDSFTVTLPFTATFAPQSVGYDTWVEVKVTSTRPIDRAYAKIDAGPWNKLNLMQSGNYGRGLGISAADGATVIFRAFDANNNYVTSAPVKWDGTFAPVFQPLNAGDDNRIEVRVTSQRAIDRTYAKIDSGPWNLLTRTGPDSWGRDLPAPDGSTVQFRSFDTTGAYATSTTHSWAPRFMADFTPLTTGNDTHIEVTVTSTDAIANVYAKINGGPWNKLTSNAPGVWGRNNLQALDGSIVQFRALDPAGVYVTSSMYAWT